MKREAFEGRSATWPWWYWFNPFWWLFGNADDGVLGPVSWQCPALRLPVGLTLAGWRPSIIWREWPESVDWPWWRGFCWWCRNPAHNLTFYGLGCVLWRHVRWGTDTDAPGWTWAITLVWGWLPIPLPYIGFNSPTWIFYLGWRPVGAFGVKCHPLTSKPG